MSRTHKTVPSRVVKAYHGTAIHDHSRGECDLPTIREILTMPSRALWGRHCRYSVPWHKWLKHFARDQDTRYYKRRRNELRYDDKALRNR